jgi:hypothetical protein
MSQPRPWVWILSAGAMALSLGTGAPSEAVTFSQAEVNQSKLVAIAVPRASGYYTLLVLEQRSNQKQCWRESGSSPTRIEPLLLNFNFTGICGRSTDSNGYSIRTAGQDLGMKYQLSFQKRKNDLVLLGVPARSGKGKGKAMELGRTHGIRSGFLKIELNDGWRFTKRTYKGKPLGHIYFSRDTAVPIYQAASSRLQNPSTPVKRAPSNVSRTATSPVNGRSLYLIMVVAPNPTQQAKVQAQRPNAFRTSHQGQTVMQVGTFNDRIKAESLKASLTRQGFRVLMVTKTASLSRLNDAMATLRPQSLPPEPASPSSAPSPSAPSPLEPLHIGRIAVPRKTVPMGHARGARNLYKAKSAPTRLSALLPPPPPSEMEQRYRVSVVASSSHQQTEVKSLVPSAFRNRRGFMQIGIYGQLKEVDPVVNLLEQNGFKPITERI